MAFETQEERTSRLRIEGLRAAQANAAGSSEEQSHVAAEGAVVNPPSRTSPLPTQQPAPVSTPAPVSPVATMESRLEQGLNRVKEALEHLGEEVKDETIKIEGAVVAEVKSFEEEI